MELDDITIAPWGAEGAEHLGDGHGRGLARRIGRADDMAYTLHQQLTVVEATAAHVGFSKCGGNDEAISARGGEDLGRAVGAVIGAIVATRDSCPVGMILAGTRGANGCNGALRSVAPTTWPAMWTAQVENISGAAIGLADGADVGAPIGTALGAASKHVGPPWMNIMRCSRF